MLNIQQNWLENELKNPNRQASLGKLSNGNENSLIKVASQNLSPDKVSKDTDTNNKGQV